MSVHFFDILVLMSCILSVQCYHISFLDYCTDASVPDPFPSSGKKSSGAFRMTESPVNGTWYPPNLNCSVTIFAEKNYLLFLTFSNISLRNSSMDNLTIVYNSGESSIVLSGQQVCSNENCEGLRFYSGNFNNLTLKFVSANATVPNNVTGFTAHYTVYNLVGSNGACKDQEQFLCENGHCVWNELVCDGHNNCGDRSDETKCVIPVKDTVWAIIIIVLAILAVLTLVPLFCCLATYGTRNIIRSITLTNQPTPLLSATDCGETSGLLTSSEVVNNCWPGTSYEQSNSLSYGTPYQGETSDNADIKKFRSMSEACDTRGGKFL